MTQFKAGDYVERVSDTGIFTRIMGTRTAVVDSVKGRTLLIKRPTGELSSWYAVHFKVINKTPSEEEEGWE